MTILSYWIRGLEKKSNTYEHERPRFPFRENHSYLASECKKYNLWIAKSVILPFLANETLLKLFKIQAGRKYLCFDPSLYWLVTAPSSRIIMICNKWVGLLSRSRLLDDRLALRNSLCFTAHHTLPYSRTVCLCRLKKEVLDTIASWRRNDIRDLKNCIGTTACVTEDKTIPGKLKEVCHACCYNNWRVENKIRNPFYRSLPRWPITVTAKRNCSRRKQIPHGEKKLLTAKRSYSRRKEIAVAIRPVIGQ